MGYFSSTDRAGRGAASSAFTHLLSTAFVAAALAITLGIRAFSPVYPTFFAFYAAVVAGAWYGGYGPGWLSVVLSTLAVNYFFLPPLYSFAPSSADLPRLIAFVICAIVASAVSARQKRVENALRLARDGLEQTVKERTAELQSTNESLSAEVQERKLAETALRASEEWWRTVFETSNVPMGVSDLSGRLVMVNAATERVLGYSSEELRSMSIADLTHEDDRDTTLPIFDELRTGQRRDYHVTKRYRCKDGSVKWLNATVTRVPNPEGGPDLAASIVADITEQKRVEEELRASEERWRRMFEHSPTAIAMIGPDRRLFAANPACQRMLGYDEGELQRMTPLDFSFEEDWERTRSVLARLLDEEEPTGRIEKRYRRSNGEVIWGEASLFRVPPTENSPAFVTSMVVEITERKRAEDSLRASEARWRSIFEHAVVGIGTIDRNRRYLSANPALQKMLGYSEEEMRGLTPADVTHPDDWEATDRGLNAVWEGRQASYHIEKRAIRKDGGVFWVDITGATVPATDSNTEFFPFIVVNVTERKRAEDSLRASEARWRSIFEHSVVGIGTTDRNRHYLSANPALQNMLGYSEEELRGLTLVEVTHPDDHDATDRGLDAVWERRQASYHIEKRMIRKDGGVIWVNITAAPVPATDSNPEFLPAIVVNVTEQKRAEEALRVSRAELTRVSRLTTMGELTASIAHEINQPLAAIAASGNACRRWLAGAQPNLDRARDSIDRMIKDAHRASEIITRIRSMTINAPPVQLAVDVNAVIDDVLSFARGELLAKGVSVRLALLEGLPVIIGDRVQLQQVVLNLVMNAVEAMASVTDRERVLAIRSRRADDGGPIVTVEDSGLGLDAANAERIFDAFFTTKPGGMGMGLSISTSIVEGHGGRLWASPNSPHGTVFHVKLPEASGAEAHSDKGALVNAC